MQRTRIFGFRRSLPKFSSEVIRCYAKKKMFPENSFGGDIFSPTLHDTNVQSNFFLQYQMYNTTQICKQMFNICPGFLWQLCQKRQKFCSWRNLFCGHCSCCSYRWPRPTCKFVDGWLNPKVIILNDSFQSLLSSVHRFLGRQLYFNYFFRFIICCFEI